MDKSFVASFKPCFSRRDAFRHLATYCRGLLSDLPCKRVGPIVLAAGAAVRTMQEFLTHHAWDHDRAIAFAGSRGRGSCRATFN